MLARYIAATVENRFPDGVFEVHLESERQIDNIGKQLGVALGDTNSGNPLTLLQERRVLVVLDSFELILRSSPPEKVKKILQVMVELLSGGSRSSSPVRIASMLTGLFPNPFADLIELRLWLCSGESQAGCTTMRMT